MFQETYLILSATGRQGGAVVDALLAKNATNVIGSSRNPESLRKKRGGAIKVVQADMSDTASIIKALDESKATRVWFTTDWYSISKPTRAKEAQLGYNVIDAVKQRSNQVQHVVFNSGAGVDTVSKKMEEFWSKADIEVYMAKELSPLQITWSVLRPVAFMENLDDEKNGNPLTKGSVKLFIKPEAPVKYISCTDIGKGSAALLMNPDLYAFQKIDAATGEYTGPELAQALSVASGVECGGYKDTDMEAFRKIVPDYQDAEAWFATKGQWADGEKFSAN